MYDSNVIVNFDQNLWEWETKRDSSEIYMLGYTLFFLVDGMNCQQNNNNIF